MTKSAVRHAAWVVAWVLFAAASVGRAQGGPAAGLNILLDEQVDFLMREDPIAASTRGDLRFNDQLRDESPGGYARRLAEVKDRLARLKALDRSALKGEDATNAALLTYDLEVFIEGAGLWREQMPMNSMDGPQISLPQIADIIPVRSAKERADYATRLEKMPGQIGQIMEQFRAGVKAGRVPPRVVMMYASAQIGEQTRAEYVEHPEKSPFYRPFLSAAEGDASAARARVAIAKGIVPAFESLRAYLDKEYIPHCREAIGQTQGVDGAAAYAYLLKKHTTTTMTADEVHALGLKEVARIRGEMERVIDETDWPEKGRYAGAERFAKFTEFLRKEPRFYYTRPQDVMRDYRDLCKRADAAMPKLFSVLPRNTYGVRPVPDFAASSAPAGQYFPGSIRSGVAGAFMVSTADLPSKPKYWMVSLTLHETVPGHHLQCAIADELEGVHKYRTLTDYTSYVEGWALYCESLGLEISDEDCGRPRVEGLSQPAALSTKRGMYADPYDYIGRLSDEIWRADRLVVDTGLHAKGWTRQQAIDYMLANSAGTEADTVIEVDRYISWPGQACAYKVGELKIKELRKRAEEKLGARFDLRAFHDQLLGGGVLPLEILEKRVNTWLLKEQSQGVK